MGQHMEYQYTTRSTTKSGLVQHTRLYKAKNCQGCPLRGMCHKGAAERVVTRNALLEHYKARARERLLTEKGEELRKRRTADVEPTFAQIKHNRNFKRFTLKGLKKVEIEFGLHALAHNIKKRTA